MSFVWTSIVDNELNVEFRISPYFGWFLKCKPGEFNGLPAYLIGFSQKRYRRTLQKDLTIVVNSISWKKSTNKKNSISKWILFLTRHLPIPIALVALKLIMGLLYRKLVKRKPDKCCAYRLLKIFFGEHDGANCLPLAMARCAFLHCMGIRCSVNIGILTPTVLSHAWIEVDNIEVLEDPDFLCLFQKVIEYV